MIKLAIGLLVVAAVLGLFLIVNFFRKKPLSLEAVILHGMFTEAGFILVFVKAYLSRFRGLFILDLVLLAIAAAWGLSLVMFFHLRDKNIPPGLLLGHACAGLAAFLVLVARSVSGG
jgi:hypothetical protein